MKIKDKELDVDFIDRRKPLTKEGASNQKIYSCYQRKK